jgi:hypothetical protein
MIWPRHLENTSNATIMKWRETKQQPRSCSLFLSSVALWRQAPFTHSGHSSYCRWLQDLKISWNRCAATAFMPKLMRYKQGQQPMPLRLTAQGILQLAGWELHQLCTFIWHQAESLMP